MEQLYDIGKLKNDPQALYEVALKFDPMDIPGDGLWDTESECFKALMRICNSLWGNLPPVVVFDFRDPDDPMTWGDFGAPPDAL